MEDVFLLYGNAKLGEIKGISADPTKQDYEVISPITQLDKPVAIDYDRSNRDIYYSDTARAIIGRRSVDEIGPGTDFITKGLLTIYIMVLRNVIIYGVSETESLVLRCLIE